MAKLLLLCESISRESKFVSLLFKLSIPRERIVPGDLILLKWWIVSLIKSMTLFPCVSKSTGLQLKCSTFPYVKKIHHDLRPDFLGHWITKHGSLGGKLSDWLCSFQWASLERKTPSFGKMLGWRICQIVLAIASLVVTYNRWSLRPLHGSSL